MTDADLLQFNLASCRRCKRVLTQASLEKGRCKPGQDCAAAALIRAATEAGHPDAISLARNVERGLMEAAGLVAGEDGLTVGARALVDSFALMI
jgi:hypothetical protein